MRNTTVYLVFIYFTLVTGCASQHFNGAEEIFGKLNELNEHDREYREEYEAAARRVVSELRWLTDEWSSGALLQSNISSECSDDFDEYRAGLEFPFKKWAIKMADSTGKPESGILDGNYIFEGRYLQCISVNEDVEKPPIDPLYCIATWRSIIPSKTPVYISGLGICIPSSCSDQDALLLFQTVYQVNKTEEEIKMRCERGNDLSKDPEAIISIIILSLFGLLVLVASVYDAVNDHKNMTRDNYISEISFKKKLPSENKAFDDNEELEKCANTNNNNDYEKAGRPDDIQLPVVQPKDAAVEMDKMSKTVPMHDAEGSIGKTEPSIWEKILLCFSLYQNVPLIVTAKQPKNAYKCLNGLRVIAMSCVVFGHSYSSGFLMAENWKVYYEAILEPAFQVVMTMEVYVDTFLILSAFLVTTSFLRQLQRRNGKLNPVDMAIHYFNRYWRLTPVYMIMLMVYTNLMHYFIAGPYATDYMADIDSCSTEWWKNLLYVNTIFISENKSCFGVSWYLCVDMQMFIIAPLFIYVLYRWKKCGIAFTIAGFTGGIIANIVLWQEYYTQSADSPDPVNSTEHIYVKTWTRCPVYFMGILLGYLFHKTGGKIKMPPVIVAIGWVVALTMFFITSYLPVLDDCYYVAEIYPECQWSVAGRVAWCTLYRPMWGIWVCWLITACEAGYGGLINTFLSWNFFVPLGKLSYTCYLVHIMVIIGYYYSVPVQLYFTHLNYMFIFIGIMVTTYMCALVVSVTILAPLTRIAAVFIPNRRGKTVR